MLIFGRQREAGQANGRWQAVFIFHQEHGGREKELSSLPRIVTSHEREQKSFGMWQGMEVWAGMAGPVYVPSCWEHAGREAGLKKPRSSSHSLQVWLWAPLGGVWGWSAPLATAVSPRSAAPCLAPLPPAQKQNWLGFIHLFLAQLMCSAWHWPRGAHTAFGALAQSAAPRVPRGQQRPGAAPRDLHLPQGGFAHQTEVW